MSYEEAFKKYLKEDLNRLSKNDLLSLLKKHRVDAPLEINEDELVHLLFGTCVEPHFKDITIIFGFPASQAALSKVKDGMARRFEIYFDSIELANGYDELLDAVEQENRFHTWNKERQLLNKEPLPIDYAFIEALSSLPDCVGVAVGFDRLMMARHHANHIKEVIPFAFDEI
jgi:lysyl-tRNA synthetase class 2